jgi:hypothetical protein
VNIRRITFTTDVHHVQSLRNRLCDLDINKSVKPEDTEREEGIMDEVRVLLDEIIHADSSTQLKIKTL